MKVLAYCVHGNLSYSVLSGVVAALERIGATVRWQWPHTNKHLFRPEESARTIQSQCLRLADADFKPDVALHTDPRCPPQVDCPVIEIPHGLASKVGYYLPDIGMKVHAQLAPSRWYATTQAAWHPQVTFIPCGMPKLDPFFYLPKVGEEVLFTPTVTAGLSSWKHIELEAACLAQKMPCAVRFHRATWEIHRPNAPKGMRLDDGHDICLSLARAKVVVSDISSSWIEAMGLGIPVVCYLTPSAQRHLEKRPMSAEAAFVQHATVITRAEELEDAIERAQPAPQEVRDQILCNVGRAAETAAREICEIATRARHGS